MDKSVSTHCQAAQGGKSGGQQEGKLPHLPQVQQQKPAGIPPLTAACLLPPSGPFTQTHGVVHALPPSAVYPHQGFAAPAPKSLQELHKQSQDRLTLPLEGIPWAQNANPQVPFSAL